MPSGGSKSNIGSADSEVTPVCDGRARVLTPARRAHARRYLPEQSIVPGAHSAPYAAQRTPPTTIGAAPGSSSSSLIASLQPLLFSISVQIWPI